MLKHLKILLEKFRGKKVAFLGLSRSNLPLVYLFSKHSREYGIKILALDHKKNEEDSEIKKLRAMGLEIRLGKDCLEKLDMDVIFRSPGIYFFSKDLEKAKKENILLTSETEEFFCIHPCKIFAITGSDGKTTTTTLISKILKNAGFSVILGGNIGNPLLDKIKSIKETDIAVVELSSFQLISMKNSPDVAVFTNISPNHLDVHRNMEEYINAKKNILNYQKKESLAVLNTKTDQKYNLSSCCKGKILYFGAYDCSEGSCYLGETNCLKNKSEKNLSALKREGLKELFKKVTEENINFHSKKGIDVFLKDKFNNFNGAFNFLGNIYFFDDDNIKYIIKIKDIKLQGKHNVENCLASICATYNLVPLEAIVKTLKEFSGVEHRIELVCKKNGVTYVNDSIATTPTRTIKGALSLFNEKIILISGGHDKNVSFKELAENIIEKVKVLILIGETAKKISSEVESLLSEKKNNINVKIFFAKSMEKAVEIANQNAVAGDVVLLSPACSSFGLYKNFEERGKHFKELVVKKTR